MQIEIRADGARICGYVNVTEKKSRPVMTPHGKVIEEIEPRAFERAIERAGNINVTVDHDDTHVYASTESGTASVVLLKTPFPARGKFPLNFIIRRSSQAGAQRGGLGNAADAGKRTVEHGDQRN